MAGEIIELVPRGGASSARKAGRRKGSYRVARLRAGMASAETKPQDEDVAQTGPEPIVEVKGSHTVDVVVNRIDGKLAVNLVNTSGPHDNETIRVFDEIQPVGPLDIAIVSDTKPHRVTLQPGNRKLLYGFKDGRIMLTIPRLDIHDIIMVE